MTTPPVPVPVDPAVVAAQDRVLNSIIDGTLDHETLRSLPRWRAVLLARVACKAGVMARADLDALVREAAVYGALRPHKPSRTP